MAAPANSEALLKGLHPRLFPGRPWPKRICLLFPLFPALLIDWMIFKKNLRLFDQPIEEFRGFSPLARHGLDGSVPSREYRHNHGEENIQAAILHPARPINGDNSIPVEVQRPGFEMILRIPNQRVRFFIRDVSGGMAAIFSFSMHMRLTLSARSLSLSSTPRLAASRTPRPSVP